jgi:CheY-like chemotaxis protein
VQGNSYDLVLMDKEMPVMDGHEVSEHSQTQNFLLHILSEMS